MKTNVYNAVNEIVGEIDLPERVFGVPWHPAVVHQALEAFRANHREVIAHTKGRGEVRGGGKKPWRQKGTGRARQGSIRSPLWKGGGVTHGPHKDRKFSKKINVRARRLALFSVLSKKLKDGDIRVIAGWDGVSSKTRDLARVLREVCGAAPHALLIPATAVKEIQRSVRNIPHVGSISPHSLNVHDLLRYRTIVIERGAVPEMEAHYRDRSSNPRQ